MDAETSGARRWRESHCGKYVVVVVFLLFIFFFFFFLLLFYIFYELLLFLPGGRRPRGKHPVGQGARLYAWHIAKGFVQASPETFPGWKVSVGFESPLVPIARSILAGNGAVFADPSCRSRNLLDACDYLEKTPRLGRACHRSVNRQPSTVCLFFFCRWRFICFPVLVFSRSSCFGTQDQAGIQRCPTDTRTPRLVVFLATVFFLFVFLLVLSPLFFKFALIYFLFYQFFHIRVVLVM